MRRVCPCAGLRPCQRFSCLPWPSPRRRCLPRCARASGWRRSPQSLCLSVHLPAPGLLTAFHRVMEIALGCVIGALTAHFVLPDRARTAIKTGTAGMLDGLGKVAAAHLTGTDTAHIDALNELVRRHLTVVTTAAAEDARERALSLRSGAPSAPLLRTLRRLRSDVAFLGRATAFQPGKAEVTMSEALARHFADAAAFLRGNGPAPALATLDGVIGMVPSDSVLGFSLVTLRRDLADLDERLAEQVRGDAANDWDAPWSCQGKTDP